jgi:3'(2'), 5'-bisphosphate nucleotidase
VAGGAIEETVKKVIALARKAGRAILEVYSSGDFGTTTKEGGSPLTLADHAANDVIIKGLNEIAPELPILSEESRQVPYSERKGWDRFWMVDPLDGTKEFIKRNGEFTVNIALIEEKFPTAGVVYAPVLGIAYYGVEGSGAFKVEGDQGGRAERISPADYNKGTLKIVASRSHKGPALERFVEKIGEAGFVSMGSSLKLCLVAEGAAHLYPRLGPTMEWDTAAAQAVVEAAGGKVEDLTGKRLSYNKEDLLNPHFVVTGSPPFPWQKFLD